MRRSFPVAIVVALLWFVGCSEDSQSVEEGQVEQVQAPIGLTVPVDRWESGVNELGGAILDVRTEAETVDGMIAGAHNIDVLSRGFEQRAEVFDKNEPLHVYCKSGGRSAKAMKLLNEAGFTEVYNMDGGFDAWVAAGKPTVKP